MPDLAITTVALTKRFDKVLAVDDLSVDIAAGTVDVVVTDGFSGNIALKTAEGTARLVTHFFREAFKASF